MLSGLSAVLSDRAMNLHKEYIIKQKLKYSVMEKSFPDIVGKNIRDISRLKIREREEIVLAKWDIMCHEKYFISFGREYQNSSAARYMCRTEASFLYEIYEMARRANHGFLVVYSYNKGKIGFTVSDEKAILNADELILAVDLCEHAYFLDYGFDKEEYLRKLLPHLNLSEIDKFYNGLLQV